MVTTWKNKETKITGREYVGWNLSFYAESFEWSINVWDIQNGVTLSPSTPHAMDMK